MCRAVVNLGELDPRGKGTECLEDCHGVRFLRALRGWCVATGVALQNQAGFSFLRSLLDGDVPIEEKFLLGSRRASSDEWCEILLYRCRPRRLPTAMSQMIIHFCNCTFPDCLEFCAEALGLGLPG